MTTHRGDGSEHGADDDVDDATRLSSRRAGSPQAPESSRRPDPSGRPEPEDDATRLALRRGGAPEAVDDDATRMASRRATPALAASPAADTGPSDDIEETTRAAGRGGGALRRPMLPPSAPAADLPRQGDFGTERERYATRPTPVVPPSVQRGMAADVPSAGVDALLSPDEVAAKRERARRRRLASIAVGVAVGAALITAVIVAALTMLQGAA